MSYLIHDVGENKVKVVNILPDNFGGRDVSGTYVFHDVGENKVKVINVINEGGLPPSFIFSFIGVVGILLTGLMYFFGEELCSHVCPYKVINADNLIAARYMFLASAFFLVCGYLSHKPIGGKK